jgi:hypothetical protein
MNVRLIVAGFLPALFVRADSGAAAESLPAQQVATRACSALLSRVNAIPGTGPVFLQSYDNVSGACSEGQPMLTGAYTYDNALAAIALVACGQREAALRGSALLAASEGDRSGAVGRIRNAYRPGTVTERPVLPMGWWSAQDGRWAEDPYQVGSATGNVAWAALALLTVGGDDGRYRAAADRLMRWVAATALDPRPPAGFIGGLYGYDDIAERLTRKSTEHNTDLAAVFDWLARLEPNNAWQANAQTARAFAAARWDEASGHFRIGTTPDGATANRRNAGLDAQLWPLLLSDAPTYGMHRSSTLSSITPRPAVSISTTIAMASGGKEPRRPLLPTAHSADRTKPTACCRRSTASSALAVSSGPPVRCD